MLSRRPFGALAFLVVGLSLALARIGAWMSIEQGPALAGVFDAGQLLAVSLAAACLSELGERLGRVPSWVHWTALSALVLVLGAVFLQDDVDGFSRRQTALPRAIALWGVVGLISSSLVLAAVVGQWLDRPRIRWIALAGALFLVTVNGIILENDYWGIHLFIACSALVGAGTAFRGALGRPERLQSLPALAATTIVVLPILFVPPPARAAAALANSTGAAFSRLFSWTAPKSERIATKGVDGVGSPWFESRAQHPPIPSTYGQLLGDKPLIVLITVDALRTDVVLSKRHDELLPTLARLRDEGLVFTQARATGTLTKTSMTGLFMGIHFSQQYWTPMKNRNGALTVHADDSVRFTELLTHSGVQTDNIRSINWLRNGVVMRGFQHDKYVEYPKKKSYYTPSPPIFKKLIPRVKKHLKAKQGAFVFSHLSDPHAPYDQGKLKQGSEFRRYLSEIELVDGQLARLLKVLQRSERRDEILLIVSADHGEAFGEHNSKTHGTTMYDETLRVPLIFWRPTARHRTVDDLVSLIDLGPTILDLFGIATPGHYMGQSLAPYLDGGSPELTRPIVAETRLMTAMVTTERLKLIVDTRSGRIELYDLTKDPGETRNLADDAALLDAPLSAMDTFFEAHTLKRNGYVPPFVK